MKHPRIAAFGITLAISSTALWAAPGDAWHGTYKDEDKIHRPPMEAAQSQPESSTYGSTYGERLAEAPAARDYYYAPEQRESTPEAPAHTARLYDPRHPQTGQLIERGLFNKTGPNDFGA